MNKHELLTGIACPRDMVRYVQEIPIPNSISTGS